MQLNTLESISLEEVYEEISLAFPRENIEKHMTNVMWKIVCEDTIYSIHSYTVEEYIDYVLSFR